MQRPGSLLNDAFLRDEVSVGPCPVPAFVLYEVCTSAMRPLDGRWHVPAVAGRTRDVAEARGMAWHGHCMAGCQQHRSLVHVALLRGHLPELTLTYKLWLWSGLGHGDGNTLEVGRFPEHPVCMASRGHGKRSRDGMYRRALEVCGLEAGCGCPVAHSRSSGRRRGASTPRGHRCRCGSSCWSKQ